MRSPFDFDPEVVRTQQHHGLDARFGDGEAPDYIESFPLSHAPWIVSTLPDYASNRALLHALDEHRFAGHIAIVARDEEDAGRLSHLDKVKVLHPFNQAADFAALDLTVRIASAELSPTKESP